ncbi:hypothetical protein [Achromobacter anxifer]|uniref:hypothetical protein n=1 Tax=Achromobacter anxifer TaxID=1287737 RepID=UPI00159059BC|nr:hypothetical protein [Achromobacter anxifer]
MESEESTKPFLNSAFVRTMLEDAHHHEQAVAAFNSEYLNYLEKDRDLIGQVLLSHLILDHFLDRYLTVANPGLTAKQKKRMGFAKKWEIKRIPPASLLELHGSGVVALNSLRNKIAHDLKAQIEPSDIEPIKTCFGPWRAASGRPEPANDVQWLVFFTQHIAFVLDSLTRGIIRYGGDKGLDGYRSWLVNAVKAPAR